MVNVSPLDISEYLDSPEVIAEYLCAAAEDPNPAVFLSALGDVARAQGMTQLAQRTGLGRESLYKTLSPTGNPTYATLHKIMAALGLTLQAVPATKLHTCCQCETADAL